MITRSRWLILLAIMLLVIAGLAACGDDDGDKTSDDQATPIPTAEDTPQPEEVTSPITIADPWVRATIPTGDDTESAESGRVTGAFMHITNHGAEIEKLIRASVPADIAGTVEIHETTIDENDVMQMRPVDGVEVAPDGNAVLKPGSYHIMLLDVQRDLNPGDSVPITLEFESGITLTVDAEVRTLE